ncbi:phage antirepressor KilAC domain-containing protein [Thalassobellus suaedae]|uniref:Phage antirepressor KilAC domain-containing protein n=1 Tax=Thalassobellus suaedae TaxID=3074124 RepID=A0ABY9XVX7_9FLAO|nr:phage antirepressor KilAC domain-containing protein [Flavobacteriaceae bacterium HL-DH14]
MNKIDLFKGIRIQEINGEILVNLQDISIGLGFTQKKSNQTYVRKETVAKYLEEFGFPISWERNTMVSESVFYLLAMKANNKTARKFQIKVATEIIPDYRKLIIPKPKQLSRKELAYMVIEAEEKAERLQLEIDTKHKPRSEFVDLVFNSDSLITMSQATKTLGLGFGRNTLFKKLRERGVLFKNTNEPKQLYIDKGYFKVKEKTFKNAEGKEKVSLQTYVTQKGLGYIAKIFEVIEFPVNNNNQSKFISA